MVVTVKAHWIVASIGAVLICSGCTAHHVSYKEISWKPDPVVPWTPPKTSLPKEFIDSAQFLLNHGFGDPRGGEFRRAWIVTNSPSGTKAVERRVLGWVLPPKAGEKQRIVLTSGVTCNLEKVGPVEDLRTLVESTNPKKISWFAGYQEPQWNSRFATLLLIHGDVALAEKVYGGMPKWIATFEHTSRHFLADLWNAAAQAFMRGDDQTALQRALQVQTSWPLYDKEAQARRKAVQIGGYAQPLPDQFFGCFSSADFLVKEILRRTNEGRGGPVDFAAIAKLPQPERINQLIGLLDLESPGEWDVETRKSLGGVPVREALAKEGFAAVEPLLNCLDTDTRLTRTQSRSNFAASSRSMPDDVSLITIQSVSVLARELVVDITYYPTHGLMDQDAKRLRNYWQTIKGRTMAENFFEILKDDNERPYRWSFAASRLFQTPLENPKAPTLADELRGKTNLSLTEVLERRVNQLLQLNERKDDPFRYEFYESLRFAQQLALCEKEKSLPVLQKTCRAVLASYQTPRGKEIQFMSTSDLAAVFDMRMLFSDKQAFPEYARFLRSLDANSLNYLPLELLAPLAHHSSEPEVAQLARELFLTPNSTLNIVELANSAKLQGASVGFLGKPFVSLDPVRQSIRQILNNKTRLGEIYWQGYNLFRGYGKQRSSGQFFPEQVDTDSLAPKEMEKRDLRVCDSWAESMSRFRGAPAFKSYWPNADKDKALKAMLAYFDQNQNRLSQLAPEPWRWESQYLARLR